MTTVRPSAKQAIEMLKIHQLRRENAAIYTEIKSLREDVASRQADLDEARKDISKLTDEFEQIRHTICDYGTRLAQLDIDSTDRATEVKGLQQTHNSFREDFFKAFDASNLQSQNAINVLVEKVTILKDQVVAWEKACADSVDELRDELASRAERGLLAELEDKLEDFVQDIDGRFEALQKISCVTDSFASRRDQESGRYIPIQNASSPTATRSSEHDSDRDRWKPIDTQAASRATPPVMPETSVQTQPRDGTDMQTPSTLRSNGSRRETISNIAHARPTVQQVSAEIVQHVNLQTVPLVVAQQQVPASRAAQKDPRTNWSALTEILKLRQGEKETLTQYFARCRVMYSQFPSDQDVVAACLRRLAIGMVRQEEKEFVREWLTTSDWTLDNAQDCLLLLTRCRSGLSMINAGLDSPEIEESITKLVEASRGDHDPHELNVSDSRSGQNLPEPLPQQDQIDEQQVLQEQMESQNKRVQPARAAKMQRTGKANEGKRLHNADADIPSQPDNANDQQRKTGRIAVNTESALPAGVNPVAEPAHAQQNAAVKKKSQRKYLERELKSLTNTEIIQKSTKEPIRAQKRKALHQPDEDTQPANRLKQGSQMLSARRQIIPKRVPTLVARGSPKATTVPETSDALGLPSMPIGPENEYGQESQEIGCAGRTTNHGHGRKLPVLSLSTSDFEE